MHIGGADLVAGRDLNLTGDSVQTDPGYDKRSRTETVEQKQSGLSVALSGAVGSALNTAVSTAQQARKESDSRLAALQHTRAALSGVQALQAQAHTTVTDADKASGFGVSASLGSQLKAGGDITLNAQQDLLLSAAADTQQTEGNNKSSGGKVMLHSGRDTTLKGAQVSGEHITADVGRDLTL